jgi:hypothetical protein
VIFIKTYFSSPPSPLSFPCQDTRCCHIRPHIPSEHLHISTWKVGGFRHDPASNHLRGCTASSLLLSNWPSNSVKCSKQSFFQKAFNQNFCFVRLVRTDSASQRPSSISALFNHSLGHGMDARLRLGRLAEHVIGFCTSTWTAAYVALTSVMFG